MYEAHFGLKNRPFGAKAEGTAVFVGPQQARIMTSLKKGLVASDAVVTVTGPVGVGKTTIVSRALESISPGRMVAWVGRMQLAPDEVLELLLAGFGVSSRSKGTIQKFAAFRRLLNERAAAGAQVAIVVEDAMRIGADALVELEALTAADTGDAASANIILMGPPELNKLLATPELARISQRNRLRQTIDSFDAVVVQGYLKHCIREAGGDFAEIFDDDVADIVNRFSGGIPRIINTLCETALTTAAASNEKRISAAIMHQVAADAFGFEPHALDATPSSVEQAAKPEPVAKAEVSPQPQNTVVESANLPITDPVSARELPATPSPALKTPEPGINDIPELINDTNPALKQLNEESTAAEFDIESTQTQKRPTAFTSDEPSGDNVEEPDFDLDQALSPETDATNLMPGLTPNLDQLAAESRNQEQQAARPDQDLDNDVVYEPTENLPTLSNSMRIDVEVEVKHAKKVIAKQAAAPVGEADNIAQPVIAAAPQSIPEPESELKTEVNTDSKIQAAAAPKAAVKPEPIAAADPAPVAEIAPAQIPAEEPQLIFESDIEPQPEFDADSEKDSVTAPAPAPDEKRSVVAKSAAETAAASKPEPQCTADSAAIPMPEANSPAEFTLEPETVPEPEAKIPRTPELQSKAKKAKRTPDIDALEAALNSAKKGDYAAQSKTAPIADLKAEGPLATAIADVVSKVEPATDIPEITLEDSLPKQSEAEQKLEQCAAEIGNANSLEDISDFAAETIFGNEAFDEIAAAVTANPPVDEISTTEAANPPVEEPSPVMLTDAETSAAANDMVAAKPAPDSKPIAEPVNTDMDASTKNRLAMVNALNNGIPTVSTPKSETIEMGEDRLAAIKRAKPTGPQPEPIENQFNTSMTQTLKALSASNVSQPKTDDEDEKSSGGLFSRFRRSS